MLYNTFPSDVVEWRLWVLERHRAQRLHSVCCEPSFGDSQWEWESVTEWYDCWSPAASPLSHSLHRDSVVSCLTNDMVTTSSSSTDCFDDWCQVSSTVCHLSYDTSSPFCRCHLLRHCHDTSASLRLLLVAGYVFCVTFSVVCYVIDSFSLFPC